VVKIVTPRAVLVPFEWNGKTWEKRDDLPRFVETKEVIEYLTLHPEVSFRKRPFFKAPEHIRLEWREHFEPDLVKEWINGVGTADWLKRHLRKTR
jgi:hypothetical protein